MPRKEKEEVRIPHGLIDNCHKMLRKMKRLSKESVFLEKVRLSSFYDLRRVIIDISLLHKKKGHLTIFNTEVIFPSKSKL